jgi:hypothetical protein
VQRKRINGHESPSSFPSILLNQSRWQNADKIYSASQHYKDLAGMVKIDIKAKIPRSQAGPSTNQFPTEYTRLSTE